MGTLTRRQQAGEIIRACLADARRQGLDEKQTLALVDASYPWGVRANWPYKCWLDARRELVTGKTSKAKSRRRYAKRAPGDWRQELTPDDVKNFWIKK